MRTRMHSGLCALNSQGTHRADFGLPQSWLLSLTYPHKGVAVTEAHMKVLTRSIAAASMAGVFALAGVSGASADVAAPEVNKVALTPEQKTAFEAAKATFQAARTARQSAMATAKATIAAAKSVKQAAIEAATTKDARVAARTTLKSVIASAKAAVPVKPVKPVRP